MSKVNYGEILSVLQEKHQLAQADAERFVSLLSDVINEGLLREKLVKVKGLGTFKMTAVRDRESVDVNTGERIVIEGRDKISFVPDAVLKEIVNKPFSSFETVALNDGVDFQDIEEPVVEEPVVEEPVVEEPVVVEPVVAEPVVESPVVEEPVAEEQSVIAEPGTVKSTLKDEPEPAHHHHHHVEDGELEEEDEEDDDPQKGYTTIKKWKLALLTTAATLFFVTTCILGYLLYDRQIASDIYTELRNVKESLFPSPPMETEPVIVIENDSVVEMPDTVAAQMDSVPAKEEAPVTSQPAAKAEEKPSAETASQASQYDKDPRVRTGAYRIVGVDQTVTVLKGQTLASISKAYLGPDMECYVEALNGKEVKEGDKVKIPKLELKRKK